MKELLVGNLSGREKVFLFHLCSLKVFFSSFVDGDLNTINYAFHKFGSVQSGIVLTRFPYILELLDVRRVE
mgnify:CR=1 FL=1